uniref:Homologous recombination OB-fold protein OB-fold domain-containing protein n=1 Tax=Oryza rufipogon TaxID=4529 RepID=A0A0E0Q6C3_ORYRU
MSQPASAAAAAAAGEEEEEDAAWADALDFDDSGFLRRGPASSPSRLRPPRPDDPAPAASLSQGAARGLRSPPHLASSGPAARGHATDPDFSLAPWLHALGSLGEGGVEAVTGSDIPCLVLRFRLLIVAWVVGVVTSCAPNRLGDLFLSLKDPSGTVGASVHQKVFTKEDNMVVSVGSCIVLKNVAVFRPSHKGCYLNVTKENLEMLVPKDFCFPSKQVFSSSPSESQHPVKCQETRDSSCQGDNRIRKTGVETYGQTTGNAVRDSTLRMDNGSTQGVGNHLDTRMKEKDINPSNKNTPSYSADQQFQKTSCSSASSDEKLSRPLEGERVHPNSKKQRGDAVLPDNVMSSTNIETYGLANNLNIGLDDVAHLVEHASIKKPNEHQQKDFITGTLGIVLPTQENSSVSNSDATTLSASLHSQPNKMASVTEWTDDQLSELFADY